MYQVTVFGGNEECLKGQLASVLLLSHILGLVLQRLAARLGVVSGMHMAEVLPLFPFTLLLLIDYTQY